MTHVRSPRATTPRSVRALALTAALLAAAFLPTAAAAAADAGDAPVISNGAVPADGVRDLKLKELWRAGGEGDDAIFGLISQALVGADGDVYLLDTQLSEVQVYSPDGEFLHTLSRQGEGPGETQTPTDMLFMPDGTLGLVQVFPGKIVKIGLDDTPAGDLVPGSSDPTQGGFMSIRGARCEGGNLVLAGQRVTINQQEGYREDDYFLAGFDETGKELHRYCEDTARLVFSNISIDEKQQYFVFRRWAVGPQGQVAVPSAWDPYRIDILAPDGTRIRTIERAYEPYERGEKENARAGALFDAARRRTEAQGLTLSFHLEKNEPSIGSMHFTPDGDLWVLPSRGMRDQPPGCMATYDVFDPEGRFKQQVRVMCDGDAVVDGLIFAGENRVLQVVGLMDAVLALQGANLQEEGQEPAPMEVVCYAVD